MTLKINLWNFLHKSKDFHIFVKHNFVNHLKLTMNAGQTNIAVGTKVKIRNIKGEDSNMNGLTGTVTHPFAFGCTDKGWVGIYLDISGNNFQDAKVNVKETEIEIILP